MPNQIFQQNQMLDARGFSNANKIEMTLFQLYLALKGKMIFACQRVRQRRALANLDERLLRDVGISKTQADIEIAKSFWCR